VGVDAEDDRRDAFVGEVDGSTAVVDDADEWTPTLDKVLDVLVVDETEGLLEWCAYVVFDVVVEFMLPRPLPIVPG